MKTEMTNSVIYFSKAELSVEQELSLENDVYVLLATRERLLQSHVALLEELITENNSCE